MIDNLEEVLPQPRQQALRLERELLDRMIDKVYLLAEDAALARIGDTQGLGGPMGDLVLKVSDRALQANVSIIPTS